MFQCVFERNTGSAENILPKHLKFFFGVFNAHLYIVKDAKEDDVIAELKPVTLANVMHSASFAGVSAKNMRKPLTIALYDGNIIVSKTLTWSVEGYVAELLAQESTSQSLRDLLNAMLVYGDSAAAYIG